MSETLDFRNPTHKGSFADLLLRDDVKVILTSEVKEAGVLIRLTVEKSKDDKLIVEWAENYYIINFLGLENTLPISLDNHANQILKRLPEQEFKIIEFDDPQL